VSTEQRAFVAVVLMAAVLILYQTFLVPSHETPPPAPVPAPSAKAPDAMPPVSPPPAAPVSAALPPPAAPGADRPPQRLARVVTPLYDAVVSSEGGKLQELRLKYRGEKPMVLVGELGPAGLVIAPGGGAAGQVVAMQLSTESLTVSPGQPAQTLTLTGTHEGLRVREVLTFRPDTYTIETAVRVENTTAEPQRVSIALPWFTRQAWHGRTEQFLGQHPTEIAWEAAGRVHRIDNLCDVAAIDAEGAWITLNSKFYAAALLPRAGDLRLVAAAAEDRKTCEAKSPEPVGRATIAAQATPTIAPRQAWEGALLTYIGPKEYDRLRTVGLQGTLNFGSFLIPQSFTGGQPMLPMAWLAVPILLLMDWVYRHVGNYGLAIILLTVVSKVLFYPLTVKSMRSMKAMQALQPQINALRNKYKGDPARMQKETMDLYRQHKVNPMGGCLPMVAQIPIFYALYLALDNAADLQGAPFICLGHLPSWMPYVGGAALWICDLAAHDPTYVLPVLMGVTMFMQQRMTPTGGGDPRQAKMMLIMPFVFTWMFFGLASGLVLYWTVSNVLQILQQWYMDRSRTRAARV
jgi:YidC/Oxa1 family membrane protein insertase